MKNKGFTLIESVIVIAIVVILFAIIIPNFIDIKSNSKHGEFIKGFIVDKRYSPKYYNGEFYVEAWFITIRQNLENEDYREKEFKVPEKSFENLNVNDFVYIEYGLWKKQE